MGVRRPAAAWRTGTVMRLVEIQDGDLDLDRVGAIRRMAGPLGGWIIEALVDGRWAEVGTYETATEAGHAYDALLLALQFPDPCGLS